MTKKIFHNHSPWKNVADLGGGWIRDLLVSSRMALPTEPPRPATEDLSWMKHISETARKANRTLGLLRRNFKDCSKQVKATTYTTVVRPILEYASPVWDPQRQADIRALECPMRAARYVNNDYTMCTSGCVTDMIKWLGWEGVEDRCYVARYSLLYKIQNGLTSISYIPWLQVTDTQESSLHSSRNASTRHTSTPSSPEPSGNGMHCQVMWPRSLQSVSGLVSPDLALPRPHSQQIQSPDCK